MLYDRPNKKTATKNTGSTSKKGTKKPVETKDQDSYKDTDEEEQKFQFQEEEDAVVPASPSPAPAARPRPDLTASNEGTGNATNSASSAVYKEVSDA